MVRQKSAYWSSIAFMSAFAQPCAAEMQHDAVPEVMTVARTSLVDEIIEGSSSIANGARLCNKELSQKQKAAFDRLYGSRVDSLRARYGHIAGSGKGDVQVDSCLTHVSQKALRKALLAFGAHLEQIEGFFISHYN